MSPDLVERAQHGDHAAFDALAVAAYDRLYAIARRILRDGYSAEDAVQDALIRAWRDLRSLRDPDRFDAWLYRLTIRACQDVVRGTRRRAVEVHIVELERADGSDQYGSVVDRDQLERAFRALSIEHRAVLVLTHYVGMTAAEVAETLGIPSGTVYSRLHYGLRTMRGVLLSPPVPVSPAPVPEQGR